MVWRSTTPASGAPCPANVSDHAEQTDDTVSTQARLDRHACDGFRSIGDVARPLVADTAALAIRNSVARGDHCGEDQMPEDSPLGPVPGTKTTSCPD